MRGFYTVLRISQGEVLRRLVGEQGDGLARLSAFALRRANPSYIHL
jgi:hypothetical protein